jgi:hypothetical protein
MFIVVARCLAAFPGRTAFQRCICSLEGKGKGKKIETKVKVPTRVWQKGSILFFFFLPIALVPLLLLLLWWLFLDVLPAPSVRSQERAFRRERRGWEMWVLEVWSGSARFFVNALFYLLLFLFSFHGAKTITVDQPAMASASAREKQKEECKVCVVGC